MSSTMRRRWMTLAVLAGFGAWTAPAEALVTLRNICHVKGQSETTLHGLGVVTGLNGTGDGGNFLPTIRSLGTMMELMGNPIGPDGAKELKDAKNVALVIVTATIPAEGAHRGDKIDCTVSALSAKSLAGGRLALTPLIGPIPENNPTVYALAQGPIALDNDEMTATGRIHEGCRLEEDFIRPFSKDGKITLVVNRDYADFQVTQDIAGAINDYVAFQSGGVQLAKALDQVTVEVSVPALYGEELVDFVSQLLRLEIVELQTRPRVVIRERSGSIVIDGDVEIGPVLVTHKNVVVETGSAMAGQFVPVDSEDPQNPKLKSLMAALNAVHVAPEDMIDIIKALHRDGKLYAQLIVE